MPGRVLVGADRGPPPRVWGYRSRTRGESTRRRSTPTRVGIPAVAWASSRGSMVHPHACGDTLCLCEPAPEVGWSTPTRVGIPFTSLMHHIRPAVHPHACGDTPRRSLQTTCCRGPPPRVWGYLVRISNSNIAFRSTPTRVGIPIPGTSSTCQHMVHPHACGDTNAPCLPSGPTGGPPPRVWGYRQCPSPSLSSGRSTPTRVGIPRGSGRRGQGLQVHPHACGDTVGAEGITVKLAGPPPRVWGYQKRQGRKR